MTSDEIKRDFNTVSEINIKMLKVRKAELLSIALSFVSDIVTRYEEEMKRPENFRKPYKPGRAALKYFKYVQGNLERRNNQIQRSNILRNSRLLTMKDYEKKIDDLIKLRTIKSLEKSKTQMEYKKSEARVMLERMLAEGYNPLQDRETREKAIEEIKKRNQLDEVDLLAKLQEFDRLKASDAGANADDFAASLLEDEEKGKGE